MTADRTGEFEQVQVVEMESVPKRKVLSLSEMMLRCDGDEGDSYVAEIGNPSYGAQPDLFAYIADTGVAIRSRGGNTELSRDDLIKIKSSTGTLGHITVGDFFGPTDRMFSGDDFQTKYFAYAQSVEQRMKLVLSFADAVGIEWNLNHHLTDYSQNRVADRNKHFSSEEFLDSMLEVLKEEYVNKKLGEFSASVDASTMSDTEYSEFSERQQRQKEQITSEIQDTIEQVKRTGVLSLSDSDSTRGIIPYFVLLCRLKGINEQSPEDIQKGFVAFRFVGDKVLEEYGRLPDSRFSDALLVACSEYVKAVSE